jgi:hypothetical protein
MNMKPLVFAVIVVCAISAVPLFAAINASGLIRRIDFVQKQGPLGEMQCIFSVQVTQIRFGPNAGTCKFYVELKDAAGKHYFGAAKVRQSTFLNSGGYAVTYTFPINIGAIDRPGIVSYAAELEVEGTVLNTYKQNVNALDQWKMQCTAYDKLNFGRPSFQNY